MDRIYFDIPGTGPYTIEPLSPLPAIADPAILDGTLEPDYVDTPIVELDGQRAGVGVDGLLIAAGHTTVRGLAIYRFGGAGIALTSGDHNAIQSCFVGTDAMGSQDQGNAGDGVRIEASSDNVIGGPEEGDGNLIAFNGEHGIGVGSGSGNAFPANAIYANGALGIDLGRDGVTARGAGASSWTHLPLLNTATSGNVISGTVRGLPRATFRIDFYASARCDPSGYGEGERFIFSTQAITDDEGEAKFSISHATLVSSGQAITATVTDEGNNTSEFGACIPVSENTAGTIVAEEPDSAPARFLLLPNYPNPFNRGTSIHFSLPAGGTVELTVFNLAGQQVAALVNGNRPAGAHTINWDGRDDHGHALASGVYLYRLQANSQVQTRKLLLLR